MSENTSETSDLSAESSENLESEQSSAELSADNTASQEEIEEFVLKVNGKEVKERVNLRDRERISKALQMEKAAHQAFQERAITAKQLQEIQEDVGEFLEQFTSNPLSVIMNPEFNLSKEQKRQLAEAILKEDLEESQKTPEQKEKEELARKYEALLAEKAALEEERRTQEQSRLEQEAAIELENEIVQAIEIGQLPKSTYISKKIADLAYIAYANGIDLSINDIIPFVKQQYKKDLSEMLGVLNDDEVEMLVSKERIRQIRNKQIQAVKPKENAPKAPLKTQDTGSSSKKAEENKKIRAKDFFKSLGV
jgi:uncharacterized protein YfeS